VFVKPIYESLLLVHADYLKIFQECIAGLEKRTDVLHLATELSAQRIGNEAIRRDISEKLLVFSKAPPCDHFRKFFEAASLYIRGPQPDKFGSGILRMFRTS
jgi:hypothetical protein